MAANMKFILVTRCLGNKAIFLLALVRAKFRARAQKFIRSNKLLPLGKFVLQIKRFIDKKPEHFAKFGQIPRKSIFP